MGLQPLFLLRRRAELLQHVHVAVVRRHAVEGERAEQRARRLLVHHRPGRPSAGPCRRIPSATAAPRGRPSSPSRAPARAASSGMFSCSEKLLRIGFERQHVLLDEGADAHAKVLDLGRQREVHDFPLPAHRDHLPAVAHDGRAGHVGAGVRRQQQQRAVEIAVLAEAADRNVAGQLLARLARQIVAVDVGDEPARRDGVDAHALEGELAPSALVIWITPALAVA